jgi:hypothetical protein
MIEKRDNLLGAWAIHCDTADCHIEVLSIDEPEVTGLAMSEGWDLKGTTHICPDCAAGASPADVIKAEATASMEKARTSKEVFAPFDPLDHDAAVVTKAEDVEKHRDKPYNFNDAGDTIRNVTAKAEDVETPAEQINREKREKRVRERLEKDRAMSKEKTLAKMGGVTDMLNDFDGMFGSSKTTWDD